MGHVHLKVADIPNTVGFYRDVLGFALMAELGPYAVFLNAGGYHHHVGANTWESASAAPPPPGSAALRHATICSRDRTHLTRARLGVPLQLGSLAERRGIRQSQSEVVKPRTARRSPLGFSRPGVKSDVMVVIPCGQED
jgi:catechol 2,3-dioxygenase-like lactoylglutathione lyase family enzyme